MPKFTLTELIKGNKDIIRYYQNAIEIWFEIRESTDFSSVERLAQILAFTQTKFEEKCGGKYIGREIMAFVGIGQFCNEFIGFDSEYDDAIKVRDAVLQSYCSIEVKWFIENAVTHFGLIDRDND